MADFFNNIFQSVISFFANTWEVLPTIVKILLIIISVLALIGIIFSAVRAICDNRKSWRRDQDESLMVSYFCGTGNYQRSLMYHEAQHLLCDYKWLWISAAGCAYRLVIFKSKYGIITFLTALASAPFIILGFFEMLLRIALGSVIFFVLNIVVFVIFSICWIITRLLIPLFRFIDYMLRPEQHCPYCHKAFKRPDFICPSCKKVHKNLAPSRYGLFFAKCQCGRFLPCSALTPIGRLEADCPACNHPLAASCASQFFVQIIGGQSTGKTAFSAAFQHLYINNSNVTMYKVDGVPEEEFSELENMFVDGTTCPSSNKSMEIYNYVLAKSGDVAKKNIVFSELPSESLMSSRAQDNLLSFGYLDGIVLLIDPLSVVTVQKECSRDAGADVLEGHSPDNMDSFVTEFVNKFQEMIGQHSLRLSNIPVAVLITKCDIKPIAEKLSVCNGGPSGEKDKACRDFLVEIGLGNAINTIESEFNDVEYFAVSAIGHVAQKTVPFEPEGVIEPIAWLMQKKEHEIYEDLETVQNAVSQEDYKAEQTEINLNDRYKKAEKLCSQGKYLEATRFFDKLGEYRDSMKRAEDLRTLRFNNAQKYLEQGDFDSAQKEFMSLGNYRNAESLVVECQQKKAFEYQKKGMYLEAVNELESLNQDDFKYEIAECKYLYAMKLIDNREYVQAREILITIPDFRDAKEKCKQIICRMIKQGIHKDVPFGKYQWQVLCVDEKNNRALLITEKCVADMFYSLDPNNISWDSCKIRDYLNSQFLNNFTKEEKERILTVRMAANEEFGTEATCDSQVYLLSINEAKHYFNGNEERMTSSDPNLSSPWWLRVSGDTEKIAVVDRYGKITSDGFRADDSNVGVRPALWIAL